MDMNEMTITPSAQDYLFDLLSNQEEDTSGIKIFVSEPGTPRAETCIAYSKDNEDFLYISTN
jgi:Fe/S biogenesis protein NfuA